MAEAIVNAKKGQSVKIPQDLLNDLSSRFIINVPEEERVDLTRLCFQIELAYWFYLDFYCEENPKLPKCHIREFIHIIFRHIPFLQSCNQEIDSVIANWKEYKAAVPTYGAIILDESLKKVLLVQSFYHKASWSFPKGKVNEEEKPCHCAIREVYEETGFDITNYIKTDQYLEHYFNEQLIRLYVISGISTEEKFKPRTRKEIKSVQWFPVSDLPTSRKDEASKIKFGPINFFMVIPFVKKLQKWIALNSPKESDNDTKLFLKQQRIFAELTKKDLEKYVNVGETFETKSSRYEKSSYSPPPRLKKKGQEKRKSSHSFQEERIIINSSLKKKHPEGEKEDKVTGDSKFMPSVIWKKFSLDHETLVAAFNINLRKTLPMKINIT